jgi:hypothetical protein
MGKNPEHYILELLTAFSLSEDVAWPLDCIECIRSRPFSFSARSCNKWALGRAILCGDAAHVFPPCKIHSLSLSQSLLISDHSWRSRNSLRVSRRHLPLLAAQTRYSTFLPRLRSSLRRLVQRTQATTGAIPGLDHRKWKLLQRALTSQSFCSKLVSLVYSTRAIVETQSSAWWQERGHDEI